MEQQTLIVGSGVAATTIAHALLEHDPNHALLILEAGPRVPLKDRRGWWDYVMFQRAPYDHCHDFPLPGAEVADPENQSTGETPWIFRESRVMGYGGSTTHWGGWGLRFKPEDFELYSRTGRGADWPLTYEELEPYYCAAESFLSVSGSDPHGWTPRSQPYPVEPYKHTAADAPMIAAFDQLGIKYAPMPMARYRKCMTTGTCKYCPIGARFVAGEVLARLAASGRFPHLQIRSRAVANQLLFDRKNRVHGVRYLDAATGQTRNAFAQHVILCAGSYETPKLLLRSHNKHWPQGVGNDFLLVGRFLVSHPFLYVRGMAPSNPQRLQQELDFPTLMSRHYDTPEHQRDGKLFIFRDRSKPRVDLVGLMRQGKTRADIDAAVTGPVQWEIQGLMEEFANPNNRVDLAPGLNHLGMPQTVIHFERAEGFAQAAQQRLQWLRDIMCQMGMTVGAEAGKDFGVLEQRGDHAASTCRMAATPNQGVVDPQLRVHGVDNLFVCSNAVFPSGAAVNPTLTVTALSLRLGKHLNNLP